MIKYNLKKILIEEDNIDLVDTSFMDKWDEVPTAGADDSWEDEQAWWDYRDDLRKYVKSRLTDYVKNNPNITYGGIGLHDGMVDHYISDWINPAHRGYYGDHIKNSRADTWIKDFHTWLWEEYHDED